MTARYFRLVAVPVSLLVTLTTTGFAQESTSGQSAAYNQVMSANPFGLILVPWYNGEYERKATERATIGLAGSRLPCGDGSVYRLRVLGQWFDGIRFYAAASSPRRSRRTRVGLR